MLTTLDRRQFLRLVGVGAAGALIACQGATNSGAPETSSGATGGAGGPRRGGTLTYVHSTDLFSFDPVDAVTGNWPMPFQLFNTLVRLDDKRRPQPELAESWSLAQDGLSLTLKLRGGVKFHDGRPLTSEDVVATVAHYKDPKAAATIRSLSLMVKDATAADPSTVRLTFVGVKAAVVVFDLLDQLFILEKDSIPQAKTKPVGTGPFRLAEWQPGDHARFERNPDYWKPGLPYLDAIVVKPIPDKQSMVINLLAGAADIAEAPAFAELRRLQATKGIEVTVDRDGSTVQDVLLNVKRPPFDNKLVRQAMTFAVDRQRFTTLYTSGVGEPWCNPVPKTSIAYVPELEKSCDFNLEKAKAMLASAGFGDGFQVSMLTSSGGFLPGSLELAQILQSDLAKIGVRLTINDLEQSVAREKLVVTGDFQMAGHFYTRSNRDPASTFEGTLAWRPDTNASGFSSARYTELLSRAGTTLDEGQRAGIFGEVTRFVVDEAFALAVAGVPRTFASRSIVQGFAWNLDGFAILERAWLDR